MKYEIIIGLEIHVQGKTKSKMFCRCDANYFHQKPNSHVCPVCLGLPGALPVPNKVAIDKCIKTSLALGCSINMYSKFDRKNYFYPDLPKGYQISQYDLPFGYEGMLTIDTKAGSKEIRITRVHMEEDTGKSIHQGTRTLLDFNKSGVPLIEIVTEPDFRTVEEVNVFAKRLKQIIKYADISNANMEKGQMRFELNMSLRKEGEQGYPPYKVEVKNIGSISVLEKVIAYEYKRQSELLDKGETPVQETRGLRDLSGVTHSQRRKEESNDYRYFPEPDIPPITYTEAQIQSLRESLPELPQEKKLRYMTMYGLDADLSETLIATKAKASWYEKAVVAAPEYAKDIARWFVGDVYGMLKAGKKKLKDLMFTPEALASLVTLLKTEKISAPSAKQVLAEMYVRGVDPVAYVAEKGLAVQNDSEAIRELVKKAIADNPKVLEDVKKNPNAAKFLIGVIMKASGGRANPKAVDSLLSEELQLLLDK